MYGNYYLRRITDHPLGAWKSNKNKVAPVTNLSNRGTVKEMRDKVPTTERIKPATTKTENNHDKKRRRTLKEVARLVIIAIRFSKAASYRKEGWIREVHGGVKMWVNQHTGEVSLESPWKLDLNIVKKNTKNLEAIQTTTQGEKKSKRLSLTQRFSMIFFGSRKQDNNDEKTVKLSLVKEYSHISTTNVTRETSIINNDEIYDNNNNNDNNPTSEIEELFKMFDEEMKKKKSLLL